MVHESWLRLVVLTLAMLLTASMILPGSSSFPSLGDNEPEKTMEVLVEARSEKFFGADDPDLQIAVVDDTFEDPDTGLLVSMVSSGDTVRWFWEGNAQHTVTSVTSLSGNDFDSGFRSAGDEPENGGDEDPFLVTFDGPDVIHYQCTVHPGMDGVLVVV